MGTAIPTRSGVLRVQRLALLFGLFCGTALAAWILLTHGRPRWALTYHVPLAVLLGCWLVRLAHEASRGGGYACLSVTVAGFGVVIGRILQGWPASGHAVLASIVLVCGAWPWLRAGAALILLQTLVDKWIRDAQPLSAVVGAGLGLLLGTLAWRLDGRRDRRRTRD